MELDPTRMKALECAVAYGCQKGLDEAQIVAAAEAFYRFLAEASPLPKPAA